MANRRRRLRGRRGRHDAQGCVEARPAAPGTVHREPVGARWVDAEVMGTVEMAAFAVLLLCLLASLASLILRLRRARGVQRQQMKWFTTSSALVGFTLVLAPVLWTTPRLESLWGPLFLVAGASVPIAGDSGDPALPPLRPRPADQPGVGLRIACRASRRNLLWHRRAVAGRAQRRRWRDGHRGCRFDAECRGLVPAGPAAAAGLHRPPLLPAQVQRAADAGGLQRAPAAGDRPGRAAGELLAAVSATIQPATSALWLRDDRAPAS